MHTIDTHSHFNLSQFDSDRDESIDRMKQAGVGTICVGIDEETSRFAVQLAQQNGIWACIGQHPTDWYKKWDPQEMNKLAQEEKVVAIGECGLDYFREEDRLHKDEQRVLFRVQIELAVAANLPLMLHIRPEQGTMDAYEEAVTILKEYKKRYPSMRGTAHFFAGTKEIVQQFLDMDFYISFSGVITIFAEYRDIVEYIPLDQILSETDAPFAAPIPYRGKRNEPAYVVEVVKKIAEIKGISIEEVQKALYTNAQTLFNLQTP